MRRRFCSAILALALSLFWVASAGAQERKGVITGNVVDKEHAVLPGAQVELQPTGRKVVSDAQGGFTIQDVAPGHYTMTISCVGFQPFSKEVDVPAGGVANVEAAMEVGSHTEVVEVRADREKGEVAALNIERSADNILQVLPAEVITSLPNTNVADAIGRLPSVSLERDEGEGKYVQIRGTEPRLNNVTVDGVHLPSPENVRNVKLDAIPSDLIDRVELSKTLSANQEGDAIGGSVNLVTKSAGNTPYLSAEGLGGYTRIAGGRSLNTLNLTAGNRFLNNKRLGLLVGGGFDYNQRGIDDVEPSQGFNPLSLPDGTPVPSGAGFSGPNGYDQREYWYYRTRYGFGGTLDYKLGDWSTAYIRGLFSQFKDAGEDWIYSPSVGSFLTPTLTNPDGTSSFTHVTRNPGQRLFSTSAGAHHTFGKTLLSYEAAFGQARFTGFFPSTNFQPTPNSPLNNVQYSLNTTDPFTPVLKALNANIFDPTQYALSRLQRGDDHTFERDVAGAVDLARNYNAGSHFSTFEVGFRVRDGHKSQFNTQQTFFANDTTALESQFLGTFTNPNYYFGAYPAYGPTTNYGKIINFFNANPSFFTQDILGDAARTLPADFNLDERIVAGYAMNTINLGTRFRLQTGVRVESTNDVFVANQIQTANRHFIPGTLTQVPGGQDYINVLPSTQLQTRFGQDTVLRLAYGIGIARPNFGDIVPFVTFDPTVRAPKPAVNAGNPALQPTHSQNFDVLFEHYLKPFGVINGGFFYKYLTNPIFNAVTPLNSGPFVGSFQNQPINGPSAHLLGVEMSWQQRLSMLPGFLNGSGVSTNYSYTTSQASFPGGVLGGRVDHPALQRQAPNNWNFDYTYDKKGLSARMGLTHNDASIFFYSFNPQAQNGPLGIKGPGGDQYLYPHTQVDLQASYWLPHGHGLQLIGYVLNLTNETFGFYQGGEQFPIQREYYSRTFTGGLKWTLGREH